LPNDPDPWPSRVGPARWEYSFAWQSLCQAGARLVFGSDWPVANQNPLVGLHAALNRQLWASGLPDQRQTMMAAIVAYTREAAYAEFQEKVKGQLKVGMLADMVLLSDNLMTTPAETIAQLQPRLTMCDGRIVYQA
jgi:predicted amidohydrolase YtcJ